MSKQISTSQKALSNEAKEDDEQLDEESNEVEADDTGSNTLIVLYKGGSGTLCSTKTSVLYKNFRVL